MCKVSVIIPYYNSKDTIIRAINSVINQTYADYELILIDDGSTDNTHQIVEDFIKANPQLNVKHLFQKNSGPSKARNYGTRNAEGKYIAFLDSDDSWDRDKLKIQIDFLEQHDEIAILGCDHNIVTNDNCIIKGLNENRFKKVNFYSRLFKNYFCTPSVVIRKNILLELGGFNEDQKYAEDTLLYLRVIRKYNGGKIELPLVSLYKNEFGQNGLSANLREIERYELKNFSQLRKENNEYNLKINFLLYITLVTFSLLKYIRRLAIVRFVRR